MDDSMNRFYKTDRIGTGRGAHHHIVYLNEESLTGALSNNNNHTHEIRWVPPTPDVPPYVDQATGQQMPGQPGQPGYWEVAEVNGHTHRIGEYVVEEEESNNDDESSEVTKVLAAYKECKEYEEDSVKNGRESFGFYEGPGQWTQEQINKLKSQDRACLVINKIKPQMNTLFSYQMEQRSDWKFWPQEGGDTKAAELASIIVKNITYQNRYNNEETRSFRDAAIAGRGLLGVSWDTSRNIAGDIIADRRRWDEVFFGPHDREDAADAQTMCCAKWYSKDRIKAEWPEKADAVQDDFDVLQKSPSKGSNYSDDEYNHVGKNIKLSFDLVNISKKEIKVIECWRKEWKLQCVGVHASDEYTLNVTNWEKSDIEAINTIPGCQIVKQRMCQTRLTTVAGATLLADEAPAKIPPIDGRVDYFPIVPIYCYKDESGGFSSIVDVAKDPQREVNKRHSQTVDILNQMASYGYWYDSSTFEDEQAEKKFRETGMRAGFMQKLAQMERKPVKEEGVKFPSELVQMVQFEDSQIQQTMNVAAQPYGANESGAMLMQKQRMKMAGNEFIFDNLRQCRFVVAKQILAYVQDKYTPQRVYRLVQNSADKDKNRIGGRPASDYSLEEISEMLQNQDLTTLDLIIDDVQWSPSIRLANMAMYGELAKNGQFPPQMLIMMNDTLPQAVRDQCLEMMNQQQQAQAESEKQKMQMEIGKTLIAKNGNVAAAQESSQGGQAPAPEQQAPAPQAMPMPVDMSMPMQMPMQVPMQQPMPMPMPQMQPQPVNIDVNVNINDKGKRVVTLGPVGMDGSVSGSISPVDESMGLPAPDVSSPEDLSMEELAPMIAELNS
jgi:hypothetical protein